MQAMRTHFDKDSAVTVCVSTVPYKSDKYILD